MAQGVSKPVDVEANRNSSARAPITPYLAINRARFEANLRSLSQRILAGKQWRPHIKAHVSPPIIRQLIAHGARGVTCSTISEGEIAAAAGAPEVLLAQPPAGSGRLERIARLSRQTTVFATIDHYVQAQALDEACGKSQATCQVLIDIDVGMHRTGVQTGRDLRDLARSISTFPNLKLAGLFGYEGQLMGLADQQMQRVQLKEVTAIFEQSRDLFLREGLCCDIVSAGGTGDVDLVTEESVVSEIQAGGGIFGDPFYTQLCQTARLEPALTLVTTVQSRPAFDRMVLDCGRKSLTPDFVAPWIIGYPDAQIISFSAEHVVVALGPRSKELRIGDTVSLQVGYADWTTPLHNAFYVTDNDQIVDVWPIGHRQP